MPHCCPGPACARSARLREGSPRSRPAPHRPRRSLHDPAPPVSLVTARGKGTGRVGAVAVGEVFPVLCSGAGDRVRRGAVCARSRRRQGRASAAEAARVPEARGAGQDERRGRERGVLPAAAASAAV